MRLLFAAAALAAIMLSNLPVAIAMETDQYNLPKEPLADIGDEVSAHLEASFHSALEKLNAEIALHESCLDGTAAKNVKCKSADKERERLAYLRSNDAIAETVYKLHGDGSIFITHIGKWLNSHRFTATPARYKTSLTDSIFVLKPINYTTMSPTVKIDGVEFGTDKLDHFFQQGYQYYKIYNKAIAKGAAPDEAVKKAISWGKKTERTYFGYWVSGVYSNADLYANYAGLKFYLSLTKPVPVGDKTRAPLFTLVDGKWQIADGITLRADMLAPFITDHMNEALNPSGFNAIVYPVVKRVVRKQACTKWRAAFPNFTKDDLAARSKSLELWYGEDYGYTRRNKMVTLADTCFTETTKLGP
ncbi:MAG: hypothetical protein ACKVQW_16170 [Pyrinomonadaceae bacterium]